MENSKSIYNSIEGDSEVDLKDLFSIYVSKWKWILVSVFVSLLIAFVYIVKTIPTYQRTTSVLMKEEYRGNSLSPSMASSLSGFGMVQSSVNIANEIITFQSPDIIHEVIKRLKLNNKYSTKGFFRDEVLYGTTLPIVVDFMDLDGSVDASVEVALGENNQVELSNFILNYGNKIENVVSIFVNIGDTVATPLGKLCVNKNDKYTDESFTSIICVKYQNDYSAISEYRSKLDVALQSKYGTVIDLTVSDQNVERSVDFLQMMITVYKEFWMKDRNEITFKTTDFINERLQFLEEDLNLVDDDIATYKSSQRLPSVSANASIDLRVAADIEKEIQDLNNQKSVATFLLDYIKNSTDKLLPANVGLSESTIQSQVSDYNRLCLQRNRLVGNSSEDNLLVKDIDSQMSALRGAIVSSVTNYISAIGLQLKSVEKNRDRINSRISSNPKQAGHLLSAERQQKVKEGLYLFLLQKKEENAMSQTFVPYNIRVVMEPEYGGGKSPIAPKKKTILLLALFAGVVLPLGFVYLVMSLNTKVRGRKDLDVLSVPFVGEIPFIGGNKKFLFLSRIAKKTTDSVDIVVKPQTRDVVNEAFRVVRTNTGFMLNNQQSKVVMVTSANVNSGKTFVTTNLSSSFGLKDEKVIVIDLDLRKKTLSKAFDCKGEKGVVDYLSGKTDKVQSLIEHKNIDVLPVGTMPPNPAELLASKRLGVLIDELRKEYDYIFIDCPPVEIVTDADIIKQWVDMTLFVVRANLLEKAILPDIERYYQEKRFNQLAIILNGTDAVGRYGYKYGYNYGGYGYGSYGGYYQ